MYLEKILTSFHLVYHKSYTGSPGIERSLGDERHTPNLFSHRTLHFGDKCQVSTILYPLPCVLRFAFTRHLLEIRIQVRDNSSRPSFLTFPAFYQRIFNYRCTGNAQLGATKPGFFNSLLSRHCKKKKKKKCARGVKSFTRMVDLKKIFAVYI